MKTLPPTTYDTIPNYPIGFELKRNPAYSIVTEYYSTANAQEVTEMLGRGNWIALDAVKSGNITMFLMGKVSSGE